MTAKEAILERIHGALNGAQGEAKTGVILREYRRHSADGEACLEEFLERVREYQVQASHTSEADLAQAIAEACQRQGAKKLAIPADLPERWRPELELLTDDNLSHQALNDVDGVITGCALAIAQTGTIVLDGGPGPGRRALSLLPDYHLCVVRAEQVVGSVPEAIEQLRPSEGRPLTFISGPSATSDIELSRVEGVHGPRRLEVLII
jgi:L-lactate dehydrogenase complex protein LldG